MLNNLLKIGTMIVAGRWLRHRWKGLLVLVAFWLTVRLLHAEYVQYVELSGDTRWLWQASLVKLGLYVSGLLAYLLVTERSLLLKAASSQKPGVTGGQTVNVPSRENGDGFDFLRQKPTLESESDKLLNKRKQGQ